MHVRGVEEGEGEWGVWMNLMGGGGKCWLWGNGATESATCCTLCKRG